MKKKFIIGADISKSTIDIHCFGKSLSLTVSNNIKGFKELLKWIKKHVSKDFERCNDGDGIHRHLHVQF